MNIELLKELTQAWGVSGREKNVRAIVKREVAGYCDEMMTDAMGNLICVKRGTGENRKKIMLSAHMDEIGMQVTKIEGDGRVRVCRVGWIWTASAYNDKVMFQNGTVGIVGCMGDIEGAHNTAQKLYIDIGCTSKEETEQYVKVGDYCGFIGAFHELKNGRVVSKSLDDRFGCYALIQAMKSNKGDMPNDVYYVFSVQEELGCRGAIVSAERIKPDIGISIDVTPDHAYPCDLEGSNEVGKGVAVGLGNPSAILDEYLVNQMIACCEENDIPYQRDVIDRGGTDASSMNMSGMGVRVATIAVVLRYPHSQSALMSTEDGDNVVRLIEKYCARTFTFDD